MRKLQIRKIINITLIILCVAFIALTAYLSVEQERREEVYQEIGNSGDLVIASLNVGKADAALLSYRDTLGIIDTGTKDAYNLIDQILSANKKRVIDYMIITHYDKDHIGSAVRLLEKYEVKALYLPDYVSAKAGYGKIREAAEGLNHVVYVSKEETLTLEDLALRIIPAEDPVSLIADPDTMDNNMSLLCMVTLKDRKFLFTGDIKQSRIEQILESKDDVKADWLKVPYHGAYESGSRDFLSAVSPQYAVISTGSERPADARMLVALTEQNIQFFNTMNGSVVTISDGKDIAVRYLEQ